MKNNSLMNIKITSQSALGAFWATFAFTIFAIHDVLIKILGTTYSVFQIIFFATLFSFIPISALMLADKKSGTFRPNNLLLVIARSLFQVVGFICAFFSFTVLELAEAYSLLFVTPLLITVFAYLFLGEVIRLRRMIALSIGFLGVIIVLRPGFSVFELGHFTAILASFCASIAFIILRKIGQVERSASVILVPMFTTLVVSGLFLPSFFVPPLLKDLVGMAAIGILSTVSQLALIGAYRVAVAGLIAPFQYTQIIWAILFGALFFGEVPDSFVLVGTALIITSGIFIIWREYKVESDQEGPVTESKSAIMDTGILSKSTSNESQ